MEETGPPLAQVNPRGALCVLRYSGGVHSQPQRALVGRKQAAHVCMLSLQKGQESQTTQLGSVVSVPAFLPVSLNEHFIYLFVCLFLRELVVFVSI